MFVIVLMVTCSHSIQAHLVDRGANGGVFGTDFHILAKNDRCVSLTGLDNHQLNNLPICTGAAYSWSHNGPVILFMHQYALIGQGKTIPT
jgi:hypothetical protein